MKSFRQTMLAICVILIASAFAGCGADTDLPDKRPALGKIEYTNLNDSGSRELLQELLSDTGVSDGRIQSFFRRVDRFNDSVKQEWLTDGFEEAELLYTKYDPYAMQDEWTAKNGTFPGYNCRITAMSLFGDFLSVSVDSQINAGEDVLFVDAETLKTDPDALGGSSLADFRALYFPFPSGTHRLYQTCRSLFGQVHLADERICPQGTLAQRCYAEPAVAGILRPVPGGGRDSIPINPVQQVLCRLSGKGQRYHAPESQAQ